MCFQLQLSLFLAVVALLSLPLPSMGANYGQLFTDEYYQGGHKYIQVADGDHNCYNILDWNDRASSIRVWANSCWRLWDEATCDRGQPVLIVTEDGPTFHYFNERISSIQGCK